MWNKRRPLLLALCISLCVYGRYGVFSGAGQHGSFGPWFCFHHETLRNALTNPNWFGHVHTFILDQHHGALPIVVTGLSTTEASVVSRRGAECLLGIMYRVIFMVGLSHHGFNLVFL